MPKCLENGFSYNIAKKRTFLKTTFWIDLCIVYSIGVKNSKIRLKFNYIAIFIFMKILYINYIG